MYKFGLLGEKLGHSYSGQIHEKLGYDYSLIEKSPEELPDFLKNRRYNGLNVTIPYKRTVMEYCDKVSPLAQRIGAVNTLFFSQGLLCGENTDYTGLSFAAGKVGISFKNATVLVLGGNGGAGSMACILAADKGAARIIAASRDPSSRENSFFSCTSYDDLPCNANIIINATPVGTYPDTEKSPVDLSAFSNLSGVIDLIYNPLRTKLLRQADDLGIKNTNGLPMLVRQATAAAEFFHGMPGIYEKQTEKILSELGSETENIVLTGMPGCGKSTIGRMISRRLGRRLEDTDKTVKMLFGRSPAEIIKEEGESAFRKKETAAIAMLAKEHSLVIATGGGAAVLKENIDLLRQNGRIYFIDRAPDRLSTYNRPLSQNGGVYRLYKERYALYLNGCDEHIDNNGSDFSAAADKIICLHHSF